MRNARAAAVVSDPYFVGPKAAPAAIREAVVPARQAVIDAVPTPRAATEMRRLPVAPMTPAKKPPPRRMVEEDTPSTPAPGFTLPPRTIPTGPRQQVTQQPPAPGFTLPPRTIPTGPRQQVTQQPPAPSGNSGGGYTPSYTPSGDSGGGGGGGGASDGGGGGDGGGGTPGAPPALDASTKQKLLAVIGALGVGYFVTKSYGLGPGVAAGGAVFIGVSKALENSPTLGNWKGVSSERFTPRKAKRSFR